MKIKLYLIIIVCSVLFFWNLFCTVVLSKECVPALSSGVEYERGLRVADFFVSEKLDGVRAYWDGNKLISRQGHVFNAPAWFTEKLPPVLLDGELWVARNSFEEVVSIVKKKKAMDHEWHKVKYMIFELPEAKGTFRERYHQMLELVENLKLPFLKVIEQSVLNDEEILSQRLDEVIAKGGEGLMLHRADSLYTTGRTNDIVKVKKYYDAEATVLGHIPGKGKFENMLGSIMVRNQDGIEFKIGTGFSDVERRNPPPVGAVITYKYLGKTASGVPRFASFLRVRPCLE